ncbi:MAG: hypothetical protein R2882_07395 [Gemmatimonadales bacterium]
MPRFAAAVAAADRCVRAYYARRCYWAGRYRGASSKWRQRAPDATNGHALFMGGVLAHLIDWDPDRGRDLIRRAIEAEPEQCRPVWLFLEPRPVVTSWPC